MAATELRPAAGARVAGALRAVLRCYAWLWGITLTVAVVTAPAGAHTRAGLRHAIGLRLSPSGNPPPSAARALELLAHNLPLAAWPLLLGLLGIEHSARATRVASLLVGACALVNAALVGLALGACGTGLLPYVPQLPFEWAGLAVGYASWPVQKRRRMGTRERACWLAVIASVLAIASVLETVAVPHR